MAIMSAAIRPLIGPSEADIIINQNNSEGPHSRCGPFLFFNNLKFLTLRTVLDIDFEDTSDDRNFDEHECAEIQLEPVSR
jgi:hypothetical protein